MPTLLIALAAGLGFIVAYHTYGQWLARRVFGLDPARETPAHTHADGSDYVPTKRAVVFGHHFTSIAGTGPIVGPAIAVMWGWLPALLWVVFGSIFIGAVHDFGALVVSLRNDGKTVGEIAGRVINRRVRLLFLLVLFMALTIVLAIFGLVIAAVFRQYPAAIAPCVIQIPIALGIGVWLHRRGRGLLLPSLLALGVMVASVVWGDAGWLHAFNERLAGMPVIAWVGVLLVYSYVASVLPVWSLLQPRDFINSLQLLSALGLIVVGLVVAAFWGGAPPVAGAARPALEVAAPMLDLHPPGAPPAYPFLFITIACGAISGFHCLVSSGTSSKQLESERDAQFVGYGSMLTEGFLATLVILACVAGLGLGVTGAGGEVLTGDAAYGSRYADWGAASGLGAKVGAFVDGAANLLRALGLSAGLATALMAVLVASFAGTTLDTACRLQRYVVQELAGTVIGSDRNPVPSRRSLNPIRILTNKHAATLLAITVAFWMAATPLPRPSPAPPAPAWQVRVQPDEDRFQYPTLWECLWAGQRSGTGSDGNETRYVWLDEDGKVPFLFLGKPRAAGLSTAWIWLKANSGKGGLILWPMFGATNQLLGGLAFLVILFWLKRRDKPTWFLVPPLVFMLVMPAWAMVHQLPGWWAAETKNWMLIVIAVATLALEAWMVGEAVALLAKRKVDSSSAAVRPQGEK